MSGNDQTRTRSDFLKKKIVIGTVTGVVNFNSSQTVFHHDDIGVEKRKRTHEVKTWVKQDALIKQHKDWNISTDPENPICERRTRENFVKDRSRTYEVNFRAETLMPAIPELIDNPSKFHISIQRPEEKERIQTIRLTDPVLAGRLPRNAEWVNHPNLVDKQKWELSTEFTQEFRKQTYDELMDASLKNTKKFNEKVSKKPTYLSPFERSQQVSEEVRKLKASKEFSYSRPVFQAPVEAVNRKMLVNRFAIEPTRKFKSTQHSGVWEFNKHEGRYMWSDTGSFDYYGRGDVEKVINPDGYNYAAPAMAKTNQDY